MAFWTIQDNLIVRELVISLLTFQIYFFQESSFWELSFERLEETIIEISRKNWEKELEYAASSDCEGRNNGVEFLIWVLQF